MSSTVFISYRRDDAKWAASAIHSELCKHLGDDKVFKDVESIVPGRPWKPALEDALDKCEATLVLIGEEWLAGGLDGRLHQEGDLVREEIAVSLLRAIPVVPVILDDADLPQPEELPGDIIELIDMQAISVSHETYKREVDNLINRLGLRRAGDTAEAQEAPVPVVDQGLRAGLVRFLSQYSQWSFSVGRITKWGAQQVGFELFAKHSTADIRDELNAMVTEGIAKTRTSKTGGTLYRLV